MTVQTIHTDDKELVVLTREAFDELMEKAGVLPPVPSPDGHGFRPAVETADALIARKIISRRMRAGLTQADLARRAGVRVETISRLEAAKHVPRQETILRIDAALRAAQRSARRVGRAA
jgi:DNA-binding XRE family transcriptional regulator